MPLELHNALTTNHLDYARHTFGGGVTTWDRALRAPSGNTIYFTICTKSCTKAKLSPLEVVLSGMLLLARRGSARRIPFFISLIGEETWL
jgi:hypothetical protein